MTRIAISLDDEVARELADLARKAQLSDEALARDAIERMVQSHHEPAIPRYARRIGPLSTGSAER